MPNKANPAEKKIIDSLKSEGYDKVWIYEAPAGETEHEHKHDYDTKVYILSGEIRIKLLNSDTITDFRLSQGQELEISKDKIHSYTVSSVGCRYIVAERHL